MTDKAATRRSGKQATRELILTTFAQMVIEDNVHDVSIQQVADRAGITHRTIYRYFPTRQDLIDQLADWLDERGREQGQTQELNDVGDLPAAVLNNSQKFDGDAELMTALVRVTWMASDISASQRRRSAAFEEGMVPLTGHLSPTDARAVTALVRYLASSRTWYAMREDFGLTGQESGPVVAWVLDLLLNALRSGEGPGGRPARGDD